MSDRIAWIAAEAEGPKIELARQQDTTEEEFIQTEPFNTKSAEEHGESQNPHFSQTAREVGHPAESNASEEPRPSLAELSERAEELERRRRVYRGRTVAMLRRYMRYSIETGRLPSLVGREFFRAKVTKYRVTTFEDRVIFVHDMETCLSRLDDFSRQVLARVVLQEYEHEEAARIFGCTRMTVHRKLLEALDRLSDILIEVDLLDTLPSHVEKSCQEGETGDFFLSDCEQEK